MSNKQEQHIFAGLELGTSNIKIVVAEIGEDSELQVLGFGMAKSAGICKGEVVDADLASGQVLQAMEIAAESAGITVEELSLQPFFISVSGGFIDGHRVSRTVELDRMSDITHGQVEELIHDVISKMVPQNGKSAQFQVIQRCFRLSNDRFTFNPVGQVSSTMECEIQYFTADSERFATTLSVLDDVVDPQNICGYLYAPLAISAAILPPCHDSDALPLVIDLGGGMTSLNMSSPIGSLVCEQIAIGCEHIVNDLQIGLDITIDQARRLLVQMNKLSCTAIAVKDGRSRMINLSSSENVEPHFVPASSVEIIVECRLRELFELIRKRLEELHAYNWLGNEIFLSGGGALIPRVTELAASIFSRKVKIARPTRVSCNAEMQDPRYNTVLGLIRGGYRDLMVQIEQQQKHGGWRGISQWFAKVFNLFGE